MKAVYTELHRSHDPQFFLVRGVVQRTTEQPERADRLLAGLKAGQGPGEPGGELECGVDPAARVGGGFDELDREVSAKHAKPLSDAELRNNVRVLASIARSIARYNTSHPTSSTRIERITLLEARPSLENMEINEKGSVNQSAVISRRASDVERLYREPIDPHVLDVALASLGAN